MDKVTKNVDKIWINKDAVVLEKPVRELYRKKVEEVLQEEVRACEQAIERLSSQEWTQVENKFFYFYKNDQYYYLVPDLTRKGIDKLVQNYWELKGLANGNVAKLKEKLETTNIQGVSVECMQNGERVNLYGDCINNPIRGCGNTWIFYLNGSNIRHFRKDSFNSTYDGYDYNAMLLPIHKSKIDMWSSVSFFVKNKILLEGFEEEEKKHFKVLFEMYQKGQIEIGTIISINNDYFEKLVSGESKEFGTKKYDREQIIKEFNGVVMSEEIQEAVVKQLLDCDKERADIVSYDSNQAYEVNRGLWDLWYQEGNVQQKNSEYIELKFHHPLVARNPVADINKNGVVGIDFGTKSTVVVLLDAHSQIYQMRIGRGEFKKKVQKSDYENPTVMEFRDIIDFMERYGKKQGRPKTLWNDITISHTALEALNTEKNSQAFYSFFSDLKQWADDSTRKIRIKDLKGHEEVLTNFLELDENSLNPIEIYAYYLGLAINNMRNGIYLDYILSYPVNYPMSVRDKIRESFERGLKKSLPTEVLNDKESMDLFRVQTGVSEPAAYAISALKGYRFEPKENEKYFYGIFDFGGGTTDFDFGIWRGANEKESRRADYVIEHFGAGGDRYLGGENLLELLAFDIFKKNKDKLLEGDFSFFKPNERSAFPGSELLISTSQEARLNTRQLMEVLRPFWESGANVTVGNTSENTEKSNDSAKQTTSGVAASTASNHSKDNKDDATQDKIEDKGNEANLPFVTGGKIKVSLFKKSGQMVSNVELAVDAKELKETIKRRIEVGVINFFEAIKNTWGSAETDGIEKINIFLAGNSCKSPIVSAIFKEKIEEKTKEILEFSKAKGNVYKNEKLFEIYPALGTPDAEEKLKSLKVQTNAGLAEYEKPTGKTGVAYGLIEGRGASRIKVVSEIKSTDEAKFKYYMGYEKRGKFHVEIPKGVEYKKWNEIYDAMEQDFDLFYTSLPEATTNEMDITRVKRISCRINQTYDEDCNIYLRAISPDTVEYVVGKQDELTGEKYIEGPYTVKLEE